MASYPAGVLLDSQGNPFSTQIPSAFTYQQQGPSYYPGAPFYGPTTIIVEPGGGKVELTQRDAMLRTMPYADVYTTQAPVGAVVGKMMRRLAILPRKVYRKPVKGQTQNGREKYPEVDTDNSLHELLHKPAPGYGPMSLREWQTLPLLTNGNSLLAKFRGGGPLDPPTEVIPLDWRFAQAWSRIGQPVIVWGTVQTGVLKWITTSEVVHTMWTSVAGSNGAWIGTSPLQQLGVTIKIDEAAAAFAAASFQNAARPGSVYTLPLDTPARQVPEIVQRVAEQVKQAYGGVDNAFKTAVIPGGGTLQPWSGTASEAQLVQTREQDFREICAVYDQPFDALFGMQAATPEGEAQVWKALMPWARVMDDRLNAQLVDPEPAWAGLFVKSDFDEVLYGDPLVLSDKMVAEFLGGIRTQTEARTPLGLNPLPGGDRLYSEIVMASPQIGPDGKPIPEQEQELGDARNISALNRLGA